MITAIIEIPEGLHPDSALLVADFAKAIAAKLIRNQEKYGLSNEWKVREWEDECRAGMMHHIEKGDPLDVAIYAAFMWHHHWNTAPLPSPPNTTP